MRVAIEYEEVESSRWRDQKLNERHPNTRQIKTNKAVGGSYDPSGSQNNVWLRLFILFDCYLGKNGNKLRPVI